MATGFAMDLLQSWRAKFIKDRMIFLKGKEIMPVLRALGAVDADVPKMQRTSENLATDPTLPFRLSRNGRFCLDFDNAKLQRMKHQPFTLAHSDDFVRYDSGKIRLFEPLEQNLSDNSVLQALFRFKAFCINGVKTPPRHLLDYNTNKFVSTLFQLRTVTNKDMLGEPALEGVHCDGVDFTMTTYLGSNNMRRDSAVTFTHDMKEKNGIRSDEADPKLVLDSNQHLDPLDTLLFSDNEQKHSLSPVFAENPDKEATRDMLVFFTRHPAQEGHVSHPYDNFIPCNDMPMEKSLPLSATA